MDYKKTVELLHQLDAGAPAEFSWKAVVIAVSRLTVSESQLPWKWPDMQGLLYSNPTQLHPTQPNPTQLTFLLSFIHMIMLCFFQLHVNLCHPWTTFRRQLLSPSGY